VAGYERIDALVNNAGGIMGKRQLTWTNPELVRQLG
jgi:NADP-dependent 3-hydroxy acid dehydrogenase YdfG